jgi:hypothetical protein
MQQALDLWDGGIRATGGTIVPERSHWYLIDLKWQQENWSQTGTRWERSGAVPEASRFSENLAGIDKGRASSTETRLGVDDYNDSFRTDAAARHSLE